TITLPAPAGIAAKRLLLVGLGPTDKISDATYSKAAVTAARIVSAKKTERIAVTVSTAGPAAFSLARRVQVLATALIVGSIGQDLYKAEKKRFPFEHVDLLPDAEFDAARELAATDAGIIIGEAINLVRELVNLPAKVIYPVSFADWAAQLAQKHGLN